MKLLSPVEPFSAVKIGTVEFSPAPRSILISLSAQLNNVPQNIYRISCVTSDRDVSRLDALSQ